MRRIAVFLLSLVVAAPLFAFNVPCEAWYWRTPVFPVYAIPGRQPMLLMAQYINDGLTFGEPSIEFDGYQYIITQPIELAASRGPSCNLTPVELPPGPVPNLVRATWYYELQGVRTEVTGADLDFGMYDLELAVVPPHPDASTLVSIVANGYTRTPPAQAAIPSRNGTHFDVRESIAATSVAIGGGNTTRTAMLGTLPPGTYDLTWSTQYPDAGPRFVSQRHVTFTVDPVPRRRGIGGGAPANAVGPCISGIAKNAVAIDSPSTMWLHATSVSGTFRFERPLVTFDGATFRVTQRAVASKDGVDCETERVELAQPLPAGGSYPVDWTTTFVDGDHATDVHRQSTVEFDARTTTLRIFPSPAPANTPLVAILGFDPAIRPPVQWTQPWIRIDGSTIFIDIDQVADQPASGIVPIPALPAGTYDIITTLHVPGGSIHHTRSTLTVS